MGTDYLITEGSGVLLDFSQVIKLVTEENLEIMRRWLLVSVKEDVEKSNAKAARFDLHDKVDLAKIMELANYFEEPPCYLKPLLEDVSLRGVTKTLEVLNEHDWDWDLRDLDYCFPKYENLVLKTWQGFFKEAYPEFPKLVDVTAFGETAGESDVPREELQYVFSDSSYEYRPSIEGEKLFKKLGYEVSVSKWTESFVT